MGAKRGKSSSRQPQSERNSQKIERTNRESMEESRLPGGSRSHLGTTDLLHPSPTLAEITPLKFLSAAQTFSPDAPFSFFNSSFSSRLTFDLHIFSLQRLQQQHVHQNGDNHLGTKLKILLGRRTKLSEQP